MLVQSIQGMAGTRDMGEPMVFACSQIDERYHGSNEDPFPTGRVPRKSQDQTSSDKLK